MSEVASHGPVARGYVALLRHPWWLLIATLLACVAAGYYSMRFSFDASSETLVVDGDPDLAAYRQIAQRFGGDEFLLMTFTPANGQALAPENLDHLRALAADVLEVDGVRGVFSVLDAPLLRSPPIPLTELANGYRTLNSPDVDRELALDELSTSPLFRELLISPDGRTTAMRIDMVDETELQRVTFAREELRQQRPLDAAGRAELQALNDAYREQRQDFLARRDVLVAQMRAIVQTHSAAGLIHLGGVPMIAADMIDFVKSDMVVFGGSVVLLIMIALFAFFPTSPVGVAAGCGQCGDDPADDGCAWLSGTAGDGHIVQLRLTTRNHDDIADDSPDRAVPRASRRGRRHRSACVRVRDDDQQICAVHLYVTDDDGGVRLADRESYRAGRGFRLDDVRRHRTCVHCHVHVFFRRR